MAHPKPIIGVTGGIGAGKSTVAAMLKSMGGAVIDSDSLAHQALDDPAIKDTLIRWWGRQLLDSCGSIDRKALAGVVFEDADKLSQLEGLLYPWIHQRRREMVDALNQDPNVIAIVLDAPKLYEAGVDQECDAVIFVDADRSERLRRLRQSKGWDESEVARRESRQIPLDTKRKKADYIVSNHSAVEELRPELQRILAEVRAKTSQPSSKTKP